MSIHVAREYLCTPWRKLVMHRKPHQEGYHPLAVLPPFLSSPRSASHSRVFLQPFPTTSAGPFSLFCSSPTWLTPWGLLLPRNITPSARSSSSLRPSLRHLPSSGLKNENRPQKNKKINRFQLTATLIYCPSPEFVPSFLQAVVTLPTGSH